MRALLDTHTFLWMVLDDPRLSRAARQLIADSSSELHLSAASVWEMALKAKAGKLKLHRELLPLVEEQMKENGIAGLAVTVLHAALSMGLPDLHRDPFDRLLVAQAQAEDLVLVSGDPEMARYGVKLVW